jgi:type IV secretory pathway ATPase VirB11/archaellum biosynthesis ATPase
VSHSRVGTRPPSGARLVTGRTLPTDAEVRIYERPDDSVRTYHVEPIEQRFDAGTAATLAAAYEHFATGRDGHARTPGRAARAVADEDDPVERLRAVLTKHTRGYGVLADVFADDRVSDAFATAPVAETPLRVRVDGEAMRTNVRLTRAGAESLASRLRRTSGRSFSRAAPTLDATARTGDREVRVAGVTDPVSDGVAFAFRARDRDAWTLPALVANGTLSPRSGALLSVAVEAGSATLVAGPRGAGKTTLLGALLWEIPARTRTVVIEDTPELPVDAVRATGRDVQALRSSLDDEGPSPTETLRTALRLGRGALVVGEVRGAEASALYEAMRVGASDGAVLGTIHGDGGAAVRERVVTDLGVPASSFGATDLLVTVEAAETPGGTERRVATIEEVHGGDDPTFATLFEREADGLEPTGRLARGNSELLASLVGPEDDYATLRDRIDRRETWLETLVADGHTDPEQVERERALTATEGRL